MLSLRAVVIGGKSWQDLGNHWLKISKKESCYMTCEIAIIKVPSPVVTAEQFAALEGVSVRTVYRWTTDDNPQLPIEPRTIRK